MPQIDLDGPAKTRTRRRDVALVVAVACATVFAACGSNARTPEAKAPVSVAGQIPGDGPSGASGDAEAAAVEAAVGDFMAAFADGDGKTACSLMTDKAVAGVVDDGKDRAVDEAFDTCIDAVEMFSEVMDDADREQLRNAEFTDTKVDGDTATVTISVDDSTIELERSADGWLLAESPVS